MRLKKPKIGDVVISDDGGSGDVKDFIVGVVAEIDEDNTYGNEELHKMYRVEWTDADTNPDADDWFSLKDLNNFVSTYRNYMKGLYESKD